MEFPKFFVNKCVEEVELEDDQEEGEDEAPIDQNPPSPQDLIHFELQIDDNEEDIFSTFFQTGNGQVEELDFNSEDSPCYVPEGLREDEVIQSLVKELQAVTVQLKEKHALADKLERMQKEQEKALKAHKVQLAALEMEVRGLERIVNYHATEKDRILAIFSKQGDVNPNRRICLEQEELKLDFFQRKLLIEGKLEEVKASFKKFNDEVAAGVASRLENSSAVGPLQPTPNEEESPFYFDEEEVRLFQEMYGDKDKVEALMVSAFEAAISAEEVKQADMENPAGKQVPKKGGRKQPNGCGCESEAGAWSPPPASSTQGQQEAKPTLSPKQKKIRNMLRIRKRK